MRGTTFWCAGAVARVCGSSERTTCSDSFPATVCVREMKSCPPRKLGKKAAGARTQSQTPCVRAEREARHCNVLGLHPVTTLGSRSYNGNPKLTLSSLEDLSFCLHAVASRHTTSSTRGARCRHRVGLLARCARSTDRHRIREARLPRG